MILSSLYMPILTIDQNEPSHYTFSQDENKIFIFYPTINVHKCSYKDDGRSNTS